VQRSIGFFAASTKKPTITRTARAPGIHGQNVPRVGGLSRQRTSVTEVHIAPKSVQPARGRRRLNDHRRSRDKRRRHSAVCLRGLCLQGPRFRPSPHRQLVRREILTHNVRAENPGRCSGRLNRFARRNIDPVRFNPGVRGRPRARTSLENRPKNLRFKQMGITVSGEKKKQRRGRPEAAAAGFLEPTRVKKLRDKRPAFHLVGSPAVGPIEDTAR